MCLKPEVQNNFQNEKKFDMRLLLCYILNGNPTKET